MEHRHKLRKQVFIYLKVFDQHTGHLLGNLGDISKQGMMIITHQPVALHQRYDIRIQLPATEDFSKKFLDITIESRWSAPDVNPELYCTGFLFVDIQVEDFAVIDQMIDLLTFEG
jgi:hypothetical protein